jgi:hypothetical protein
MKTLARLATAAILSLATLSTDAVAQVPATLTQQGSLFDVDGNPLSGTYDVTYALYTDASSATPVWSETIEISAVEGQFVAELGTTSPMGNVFDGSVLYLGMSIDGDPEIVPRERISSVPYALVAGDVSGDIHPASVVVDGVTVIDSTGHWVGDMAGLQGPRGEQGPAGDPGEQGPPGLTPEISPRHFDGECGRIGVSIGWAGSWVNICDGAPGEQGPPGERGEQGPPGEQGPAGTFAISSGTSAVFGTGPFVMASGDGWTLEASDPASIVLTSTSSAAINLNLEYTETCAGSASAGRADTVQAFGEFSFAGGNVAGTLCSPGAVARATIFSPSSNTLEQVNCMKTAVNEIRCFRVF